MKRFCFTFLSVALCFSLFVYSLAVNYTTEEPGFNAATFTDAADIQHWEAVASLAKLGVIIEEDDGAFHPTDTLTRAEAAKLITLIFYKGKDPAFLDSDRYYIAEKKDIPTFSDIQDHWAEIHIEYCAELHILAGRGDGRFDPDSQVTGVELLKMALSMLGYGGNEDIVGDSWAEQTTSLARYTSPSLYEKLENVVLTMPITRDNAAQVLYNALCATPKVIVREHRNDDGQLIQTFADYSPRDGSPATLLHMFYNLDEIGSLPDQPK